MRAPGGGVVGECPAAGQRGGGAAGRAQCRAGRRRRRTRCRGRARVHRLQYTRQG